MRRLFYTGLILGCLALPTRSRAAEVLDDALEAEIQRASAEIQLPNQPRPYWIQAEVLDGDVATSRASFGALLADDHDPYRNLRTEVRVGSYALDSSNFEGGFGGRDGVTNRGLPLDDVPIALRREIWLALDESYKGATEAYTAKQAARQGRDKAHPPDLAEISPLQTSPVARPSADGAATRTWATRLSAVLGELPGLEEATAVARDWQGTRLLVSTEGTRAWLPTGFTVVVVQASTRASDGAPLRDARWWVARRADLLPSIEVMEAEVRAMGQHLVSLREAPVVEDYLGPVLFEQPASVELFRQLLQSEICGTPPIESASDSFSDASEPRELARVGRRLLPQGWTVVDDPSALADAAGAYAYDFEGVPAEKVELVRDGLVHDLLMSRIPRAGITHSNGHGRALGVDRRAALPGIIRVSSPSSHSQRWLERRALQLARQAGEPYAIVVTRMLPPSLAGDLQVAFSGDAPLPGLTAPVEAFRIWPEGRREAVRGLSFVGVDRRSLKDIVAAGAEGDPAGVLDTGQEGGRYSLGEVGGLPVTWITPPVLVAELELHGSSSGEPRAIPAP